MKKSEIISKFYPFNNPQLIDSMLIGNDLDAILSAVYLHDKFGWEIVGLYNLSNIYCDKKDDIRQKIIDKKIIAVDLDIYHKSIPSVGHHILQLDKNDKLTGFHNSINPNFIRERTQKNYRNKYPLGTIHFLRWLFDDTKKSDEFELLCWLADSSYINAQKYHANVEEWLLNFMNCDCFMEIFKKIDSIEFETKMKINILSKLHKINLDNETAMTKSKYLNLQGFQTRIKNLESDRVEIIKLLIFISKLSGYNIPDWPQKFEIIHGNRENKSLSEILKKYQSLDDFLIQENIFSYAITYQKTINYTKFKKR